MKERRNGSSPTPKGHLMSYTNVADVLENVLSLERSGQFAEARDVLRQSLDGVDGASLFTLQLRLAKVCIFLGPHCFDEAEQLLTAARTAAASANSPPHVAVSLQLHALLERRRGRPSVAQTLLDESPILKDPAPPPAEAAHFFYVRGLLESDAGSHSDAERFLIRAYQLYEECGDVSGRTDVCDTLATLLLNWGNTVSAQKFCERSLELKRSAGDRFGLLSALSTLGRIFVRRSRLDEAESTFQTCLRNARELGESRGIPALLCSLGEVALLRRDFDAATQHFQDSIHSAPELLNQLRGRFGLARTCLMLGRIEEAERAADALQSALEKLSPIPGMPAALDGLRGAVAWRRGDLMSGEQQLRRCIDIQCDQGRGLEAIPFLYELRDLHQSSGNIERAISVMSGALLLLGENGSERVQVDLEAWLQTVDNPWLTRLAVERSIPARVVAGDRQQQSLALKPCTQPVAVLFCDVRGYTAICEGLPPEEVVELLNEWFSEATRSIERHGGVVDKYVGDAVLAVFGVPEARDDAAADAVRAALDMREALNALNLRQQILRSREIRVGIGIDTGMAVVGLIGSPLHREHSAIGDPVNTASRLEEATKNFPGCDILTSQSVEDIQQKYEVAETMFLGNLVLKGKAEKVPCYQVHGPKSAPSTGDTVVLGEGEA